MDILDQSPIFLYGPPASGKSTLGRRLAQALDWSFADLDTLIETQAGLTVPEIFESEGEAGFRSRETRALQEAAQIPGRVIALGGGALLHEDNRRIAESAGRVVCLQASLETILQRLTRGDGGRPLLNGDLQARLQALLEQRADHYASFPLQIDASAGAPEQICPLVQARLGLFRVSGMGRPYDVRIARGLLDQLGGMLQARGLHGPLALVSDENVAALHAGRALEALRSAGYRAELITIPAGEATKTIETVGRVWAGLLAAGLERRSTLVALGGGVVGDLAGFAAATYLRGVSWVGVPTSLLAMVDASLGGKTGADLPQGKNLVGAFHPPALVAIDPGLLDSLPEVELRNGLAEVVKHGVLGDAQLFEMVGRGWASVLANLDEIVRRAVAVKVGVIGRDPYERGERAALNLGHTLGHAIELASDYRVKHGEGVAIGMLAAARLSERRGLAPAGLAAQVQAALEGLGLPTALPPGLDPAVLRRGMGVDKKRAGGQLRLVLPLEIGATRWNVPANDPDELIACAG
ncbi:MAG: 3-dehydroquinate synthase [Chloroflexota bacterium]